MKIGFFDSGLGGLTIFKEAINSYKANYVYLGDNGHAPYGVKSKEEVKEYVFKCIKYLIDCECKLIVIACNTATSICINDLREMYSNICFIGTEPAIKPAIVKNPNKKILVTATTLTLKEEKLKNLMNALDVKNNFELLPMDKLVEFAEHGDKIDYLSANNYIKESLEKINFKEYSSIVLGCTHFPIFENEFKNNVPNYIEIIDSAKGVVNNVISHAKDMNLENNMDIEINITKPDEYFFEKATSILDIKKEDMRCKIISNSIA